MSAITPVLSVTKLNKSFNGKAAVTDVSLSIHKGEVFGFLGPNGAGKSTTIRLILDILRPDSGEVTIFGKSHRDTKNVHQRIGYMSGEIVIDLDLTGRQYLNLISNLHGGSYSKNIEHLAKQLGAQLDLKISNYSRGNRQKIALVAALLHEPELLILDEPTSGFDPLVQATFAQLIEEFVQGGGTVFMSSHILSEVQELCDRVAFIKGGKIIKTTSIADLALAATKQITVTAAHDHLATLKADAEKLDGATNIKELGTKLTFNYSGEIHALINYLTSKVITDATIREPELEEIFGEYYTTREEEAQA